MACCQQFVAKFSPLDVSDGSLFLIANRLCLDGIERRETFLLSVKRSVRLGAIRSTFESGSSEPGDTILPRNE